MAPIYWLFTRAHTARITLHLDDCVTRRGIGAKQWRQWTGPLTSQQVAVLPTDTYHVCACVVPTGHRTKAYGPRRVLSANFTRRNIITRAKPVTY